ncbi:MAG: RnfH family protein [Burkholderiales bacterium]
MRVVVAFAAPGVARVVPVDVPATARVADAVAASGLVADLGLDERAIAFAIFGQRADPDLPLREGDRVEITRPLVADPKAVRAARAAERPLPRTRKPPRNRG